VAPVGDDPGLEPFIQERLGSDTCHLYADVHGYVDRLFLPLVLEHTRGSQHQAARRLGIARETLRRRLRELALRVTQAVEPVEDHLVSC